MSSKEGPKRIKYFMPKNINCITVIITLEDIKKYKLFKKTTKQSRTITQVFTQCVTFADCRLPRQIALINII